MQAIKLKATIDASHRLELVLPADTPTGEAEVIVLVPERTTPQSSQSLLAFLHDLDRRQIRQPRTAQEIEDQIAAERNSWE